MVCFGHSQWWNMDSVSAKYLIVDGIGGVPLGRELFDAFVERGVNAVYWNALEQKPRRFYKLISSVVKAKNKLRNRDGFSHFPRLLMAPLEELLLREAPTHVLVVGFLYKHYDVAKLSALVRKAGAKFILYDTDSCNLYSKRREFLYFLQEELPRYDKLFSFSEVTTRFFREVLGLDARYLPFGAVTVPALNVEKVRDVVLVGSADLRRVFLLESIRDYLTVRGSRWKRNFPIMSEGLRQRVDDHPVWGAELQKLLQEAKIVLNITRSDFYGAETGVNLRIFEAVAAGCFLLTDYCEEITSLFTPGEEIEVFRSGAELRDKVIYYLAHSDERERIARNGRERFLRDHIWRNRVEQILLAE